MKTEGQEGSLWEYFLGKVGVMLRVTEIKTFFCELASQEWELGMCVALTEEVGALFLPNCPGSITKRWFALTSLLMLRLFPDSIFLFSFLPFLKY